MHVRPAQRLSEVDRRAGGSGRGGLQYERRSSGVLHGDSDRLVQREGRSNQAIAERLFLSPKTVEARVGAIFAKLGLATAPDDHRRVLAVLTYLRSSQ